MKAQKRPKSTNSPDKSRRDAKARAALPASDFQALIDYCDDAAIIRSIDGTILSWNRAAEKLYGFSRNEAVGKSFSMIVPADRMQEISWVCDRLRQNERVDRLETVRKTKNGALIEVTVNVTALKDFSGKVIGALIFAREIGDSKKIEQAMLQSEYIFRQMAENISHVFWLTNPAKNEMIYISPAYEQVWGRSRESLYQSPQNWVDAIEPEDRERVLHAAMTRQAIGEYDESYRIRRPDGQLRWIRDRAFPIKDTAGKVFRVAGIAEDITQQVKSAEILQQTEAQLRQAHKMEAVGRLAGGVAHDFNNQMTAILGYCEMIERGEENHAAIHADINEIRKAAERAANLTRQLLAFGRKQILQPKIIDINEQLSQLEKMLRRLIVEDIDLNLNLAQDLPKVRVDPTQMDQVIINLVLNARDAMPRGGKLTIKSFQASFGGELLLHPDFKPGKYIVIAISDTGHGIDPKVLPHLFEPFFTTKDVGKGTGLGLSTVYGIVTQSGGYITVYSEPKLGSTFKIYLPVSSDREAQAPAMADRTESLKGTETILLLEDETGVRNLAARVLNSYGYTVLESDNADVAISISTTHKGTIHLLLTDVVLPGKSGREAAESIAIQRPEVKVLYISGYTEDVILQHGLLKSHIRLLQKPFSQDILLSAIRQILDEKTP